VERLIHEGLAIAESVARGMHYRMGRLVGVDELLAVARSVVLEAARAWDPARVPFEPYVIQRLKWAMLDEARRVRRTRRIRARAAACAALERLAEDAAEQGTEGGALRSEEEYQADLGRLLAQRAAAMTVGLVSLPDTERHPDERVAREELRRDMKRAIEELPDRQRALVERHYFGEEQFEAIAEDLGISKSWASRQHTLAIDRLAKLLRERA
jgi:RNA polymerase sigma factor for flagellar operon FliA